MAMGDKRVPNPQLGKRKRRRDPNPNPLFAKWLAQWRDEAREKGWKSEFIYSKALSSLKKYPLPLSTGKECKILQHFGDKICKMLDDRLLKHKQEQENAASVSDFDIGFNSALTTCPHLPAPATTHPRLPASATTHPRLPAPVHEISDASDEEANAAWIPKSLGHSQSMQSDSEERRRMRTADQKHCYQTSSTQQLGLVSRNMHKTVGVDNNDDGVDGYVDDDVSILHHTSPMKPASVHSDDDFSEVPVLPDLENGECDDSKVNGSVTKSSLISHGVNIGVTTVRVTHSISILDGDEAGQTVPPQKAVGRAADRQPREYVPAYRSGPYAILLTLYRQAQNSSFSGFMTKAELCQAAQPLADKSFTVADSGSRYTAWSSVSTLIKKGYLIKESSPARYRLTNAGSELAQRLEEVEGRQRQTGAVGSDRLQLDVGVADGVDSSGHFRSPSAADCDIRTTLSSHREAATISPMNTLVQEKSTGLPHITTTEAASDSSAAANTNSVHSTRKEDIFRSQPAECIAIDDSEGNDDDDEESDEELPELMLPSLASRLKLSSTSPPSLSTQCADNRKIQYWYLAEGDRLVTRKDQACVNIDENGVSFLVKINYQQLLQSGWHYTLDVTRPLGDCVFAYLNDGDCREEVQPPAHIHTPSADVLTTTEAPPSTVLVRSSTASKESRPVHAISDNDSEDDQALSISDNLPDICEPCSLPSYTSVKSRRAPTSGLLSTAINHGYTVSTNAQSTASGAFQKVPSFSDADRKLDSGNSLASNAVQDFVLWPGTFDIVLLIDNREFYGSQSSSKSLVPDLLKNGVTCELRLLSVGDLLWVARERLPHRFQAAGQEETTRSRKELVLNYIVERKRMDDLVSSIVSGRLKEQKFRLKHSGLQEKIILIESYGSMQHFSISEDRIRQSIANTEIIDGFTVKQTHDAKETAAYLTFMTRYLQSYYQNKTLRSCSRVTIKDLGIKFDISDTEQMLMPFDHFNQASLKNKPLTVRELFGKQLIQLWGMSAEKARAIVERYPTPTRLLEAYAACTPEESDSLLANLKFGKNHRNLGKALSRQVAQLYTSKTLT